MQKEAVIILLFVLIAYPLVVLAVSCTQKVVIFQSRGVVHAPPQHLRIHEANLKTMDGERLHAWWLQTAGATKTVLFFQGNGTNISHKRTRLDTFGHLGLNALLVDYRGFGKSSGRINNEVDIYTDGATAWNYLVVEKKIAPETIIVWGRSLGGGVATEIARSKRIFALILEACFYSLDDIARRQYWFLPTAWLLDFHFENGRKLKQLHAPVIIIHSREDRYIPFDQARKLLAAAAEPKFMIPTRGSHLELFEEDPAALAALQALLTRQPLLKGHHAYLYPP